MKARAGYLVVACLSGFCVIVLEFAAVRMMAPAFGQSITVWSTVIGVILLALALGYWAGGRLGERSSTGRPLFTLYAVCGLFVIGVSRLGPGLCRALIPTGLPGERLLPLGFTGSLVASLALFAFPVFALGMTSPFLIRLGAREGHEGRTVGGIYAFGTVGSLVGCYLAPLVLLQVIGTRGTIFGAGVGLVVLAALAHLVAGRGEPGVEIPRNPGH